jgi:hypothetical protein
VNAKLQKVLLLIGTTSGQYDRAFYTECCRLIEDAELHPQQFSPAELVVVHQLLKPICDVVERHLGLPNFEDDAA